jgi:hypothetical protein
MSNGQKRLDQVVVGDYVRLNAIIARVDAAEFTGIKDVIEIEFTDGTKIQATPEHKFLTTDGLVLADALRYNTQVFTEDSIPCNSILAKTGVRSYLSTNAKSLMEGGFTSGKTTDTLRQNTLKPVLCTGMFGSTTMVKYLKGIISTIKMAIKPTTIYPILNAYQGQTTASTMPQQTHGLVLKQTSDSLLKRKNRLKNGTGLKQEESGTQNTGKGLGKTGWSVMRLVNSAVLYFKRITQKEPSSVTKTVRQITVVGKKPTFDLTVNHHHAYIANGVVVSNSDAFRYLATGMNDVSSWSKPLKVNTGWVV